MMRMLLIVAALGLVLQCAPVEAHGRGRDCPYGYRAPLAQWSLFTPVYNPPLDTPDAAYAYQGPLRYHRYRRNPNLGQPGYGRPLGYYNGGASFGWSGDD